MTSNGAVGPAALRGNTIRYRIYESLLLKDPRDMGVLNTTRFVSLTPVDQTHTPCLEIPRSCFGQISVHFAQCLTTTREPSQHVNTQLSHFFRYLWIPFTSWRWHVAFTWAEISHATPEWPCSGYGLASFNFFEPFMLCEQSNFHFREKLRHFEWDKWQWKRVASRVSASPSMHSVNVIHIMAVLSSVLILMARRTVLIPYFVVGFFRWSSGFGVSMAGCTLLHFLSKATMWTGSAEATCLSYYDIYCHLAITYLVLLTVIRPSFGINWSNPHLLAQQGPYASCESVHFALVGGMRWLSLAVFNMYLHWMYLRSQISIISIHL